MEGTTKHMPAPNTKQMVLLVVRDASRLGGGGVSPATYARHLGISEGTARRYLSGLHIAGHVTRVKRGRSNLYRV